MAGTERHLSKAVRYAALQWHGLSLAWTRNVSGGFLHSIPTDWRSRLFTVWLRACGATIGPRSRVHYRVSIIHPSNLHVGADVAIPASTDLAALAPVTIGDRTLIGAGVRFITNDHPLVESPNGERLRDPVGTQMPITCEPDVWLMNDVRLIAGRNGLTIGRGARIAAGAVVVSDVPPLELWGGVPARPLRSGDHAN